MTVSTLFPNREKSRGRAAAVDSETQHGDIDFMSFFDVLFCTGRCVVCFNATVSISQRYRKLETIPNPLSERDAILRTNHSNLFAISYFWMCHTLAQHAWVFAKGNSHVCSTPTVTAVTGPLNEKSQ